MRKKNPTVPSSHPRGVRSDYVFRSVVTGTRAPSFKRYSQVVESGVLQQDFDQETRRMLRSFGIYATED